MSHPICPLSVLLLRPEPQLKGILGAKVCDNMLFVHALLGCDTTSHIYGLGKGVALQLIRTDKTFQEMAKVFRDANKKKEVIIAAGEKAIVLAHKGLPKDNLDNLRLPSSIACGSTYKCSSGWDKGTS